MDNYAPELYLLAVAIIFGGGGYLLVRYESRKFDRKWGKRD